MRITKRQLRRIIKEWRQNPAKIRQARRERDRQRMIDTMSFDQLKRKAFDSAQGINGRLDTGQYEYADIWEVEIPMLADYVDAAKIKAAEEGVAYDDVPEVRHNGGLVDLSEYSLGLPDGIKESTMKITKNQLRRIIKEELLRESQWQDNYDSWTAQRDKERAAEAEVKAELADLMSSKLFANAAPADKAEAEKIILKAVMSLQMNGGQQRHYPEFLDDAMGGYGSELQQRLATAAGSNIDSWGEALAAWGDGEEGYEGWM